MKVKKAANGKTKPTKEPDHSTKLFPVVGIGASAGGLEAYKKLLPAIPVNSGMAYVLVQHIDPTHQSLLTVLLQKTTAIPVIEITDKVQVQPDHIYVIPSNKMLMAKDNILQLSPRPAKNKVQRNEVIDIFFTSLAEVYEAYAIGIVLSGTATDGTKGLKAIKDHGGITLTQSIASAAYEGMPNSAIESGFVDFILDPEKMPQKLLEISKAIAATGSGMLPEKEEEIFKEILLLLHIRKGMDFTYYKQSTVRRRILRRMILNKFKKIASYLNYLQENKTEQDALYQDMLIPVTSFFRDIKTFNNLCESVFPSLIKNKSADGLIRIWVAGCSTGEEAYSIAICFKEYLGIKKEKVQIFATDLSEPAIVKARAGIYSKAEAETVSPHRLKEYFTYTQGCYQVNKELRDMCVFAVHNFLKDPPFSRIDFISCRNVLIYMDTYLQKKALSTFHYALNPKGLLMLGKSENTIGITDLFAASSKIEKIFTRKDVPSKMMPVTGRHAEPVLPEIKSTIKTESVRTDFQKIADELILKEHIPAAVVVNEALDIVHFRGDTSFYLKQFPGKPTHNLIKMARMGLAVELRNILHKVKKDGKHYKKENIPVQVNKVKQTISIEVKRLPHTIEPYYLILFNQQATEKNKHSSAKKSSGNHKDDYAVLIQQLEQELSLLREDMRTITEDQEASNEELQSTNEELQSSNEELQSLNEELETSKEELQSTIEELTVVNQEMVNLNEQLATEKEYVEESRKKIKESEEQYHQLIDSLPPLVWQTDAQGNQTYASKRWKEFTGLEPENADSFEKMVHPDDIADIIKAWTTSLATRKTYRHEVRLKSKTGKYHWFQVHGEPLYNDKKEIEKWIGAFTDITVRKEAEEGIKESEEQFSTLAENMENLAWLANGDGWIYWYNKRWYDFTGTTLEEMQGWGWSKVHHPDHTDRVIQFVKKAWLINEPFELTFPLRGADGNYKWFLTRAYPVVNDKGEITRWIGTNTNIDEQKKAEDQFRILSDQAPMWVWLTDTALNVLYANTELLKFVGLADYKDFTGLVWKQKVHPDDITEVYQFFGEAASLQKSFTIECRILNAATADYAWFYIKCVPRFEANEFTGFIGTAINIQKQKSTLSQLEYRKALLEAHNEASFDGILLVDAMGKILSYNHKFIEIWNMPQHIVDAKDDEAALSFAMKQLVHPEQFIEKVKWLYEHPTETSTDILEYKDGKIVERHGYPVVAEDGSYYAWSWNFRDITEQTQAEIKIKESEKQLRKTTEHFEIATNAAEVGTWSLDLFSQRLDWSGLHKKMWGYDEQHKDLVYEDWHTIILPEDKEAAFAEIEKALRTKTLYEATYRIKRADNEEVRWIRSSGQYFYDDAGEAVTLTGVSIDITQEKNADLALRKSEANFRLLADTMPQHVWTADVEGNLNYFNQKVFDYSGLSLEQIIKDGWLQIVHPDDREENIKQWRESITTGRDFLCEHRFKRYDGEYRWQLSRAVPQKDGDGNITMWVGSSAEIQKLKEEEQRKDDFLKMVSHELKTPVTSVKGYVQLLLSMLKEEQDTPAAVLETPLLRIDNQVGRLGRLIAEMLDISRLESGKLEMQKELIRLDELLEETVQDIRFTNTGHTISISRTVEVAVYADKNRIGQVIINLVNNAIKYSPDNNSIEIWIDKAGEKEVVVSIKDYGIGIDKEHQQKIFERFYRAEGQSEKNYSGFGIGLFIVKEIIERHDGLLTVESEIGKGSVFTFILPLATENKK